MIGSEIGGNMASKTDGIWSDDRQRSLVSSQMVVPKRLRKIAPTKYSFLFQNPFPARRRSSKGTMAHPSACGFGSTTRRFIPAHHQPVTPTEHIYKEFCRRMDLPPTALESKPAPTDSVL